LLVLLQALLVCWTSAYVPSHTPLPLLCAALLLLLLLLLLCAALLLARRLDGGAQQEQLEASYRDYLQVWTVILGVFFAVTQLSITVL
jgi:hypothetical protein